MSQPVKIQIYEHKTEEVVIDTFEAKCWDDFLVIEVDDLIDQAMADYIREIVGEYAEDHPEKQIIIAPKSINLTFHGFKEVDDGVEPEARSVSEG